VADNVAKRSGWITFAGVMAVLASGYNALSGIAALADDDTIASQAKEVLYGIDLTAWGWFWLLVALAQILTGVLIFQRNTWGALARRRLCGPERDADRHRDVRLPALGDRGADDRLPRPIRAVDPKCRVPGVTVPDLSGAYRAEMLLRP
jgi:hypothetical protein